MPGDSIVETPSGRLRGRRTNTGSEFAGIPYGSAPRFAPPVASGRWIGIRDALAPGPAAPQPERPVASFTHGELGATSEDCLYLNVFTPSRTGRRPVLVWLHGGGFTIGHAAASLYHGARLADQADAVVVTVNYRLGSLGWLAHPELAPDDRAPTGNWGLLDQLAALGWVHEQIESFGGDATQVTLAGQSAGALSAMDLLIAPGGQPPFRRAILQSPPIGDVAQTAERASAWAQALSERAGAGPGFDTALLRSLPAERIVALQEELLAQPAFRGTRGGALPTLDPASLPRSPRDDPGAAPRVDVLIGSTGEEGTFYFDSPWRPPPPDDAVAGIVGHLPGINDAAEALERYGARARRLGRAAGPRALLVQIATDALIAEPVARWASARASALAGSPASVHRYRVDHRGAGDQLGATHTVEVPLLFGTWADGGPGQRLGGQGTGAAAVARAMLGAWRGFVHGDGPGWKALGADGQASEVAVFGGEEPFTVESGRERR